jgi:protocatechuate 3,4-dioxygenase beta subunit
MSRFDALTTGREPRWQAGTVDQARRRTVLGLTGLLAGGAAGRVLGQSVGSCLLTPDSGEGPFYFDPELLRADITEDAPGAPVELGLQILRAGDCATLVDARIDVWHADALGLYSGYADQPGVGGISTQPAVGRTFLRGTQFSDADGRAAFRTIYPSWYGGRTPHIHFKVFLASSEIVAGQIFFPDEVNREIFEQWDPYRAHVSKRRTFNDDDMFLVAGAAGGVFADVVRTDDDYRADVVIVVDTG